MCDGIIKLTIYFVTRLDARNISHKHFLDKCNLIKIMKIELVSLVNFEYISKVLLQILLFIIIIIIIINLYK